MTAAPPVSAPHDALGHGARSRSAAGADWDAVLTAASSIPAAYTRALVEYQTRYMMDVVDEYVDLSAVLYNDARPVAVWPLCAYRRGQTWTLASQEGPVRAPLFAGHVTTRTRKRIVDSCRTFLTERAKALGVGHLRFTEAIRGEPFDAWHRSIVELGATTTLTHGVYVDLTLDLAEIRARMRDRYKSLVNKGLALWKVAVIEEDAPDVFDEFRLLHLAVAGRATRSRATWDIQQAAIASGDAFLVTLRDDVGKLVGGGLFHVSRTDGVYAVGAYDRSLFEMPLGHTVQWKAIETMKRRGLSWHFIGIRSYPQDRPEPTPKELQIGHFKEGFATHVFPHLELACELSNLDRDRDRDREREAE